MFISNLLTYSFTQLMRFIYLKNPSSVVDGGVNGPFF